MAHTYKVLKQYASFEVGAVLELTGDKTQYTDGKTYIEKEVVEGNAEVFELQTVERKPLTAESFFGEI